MTGTHVTLAEVAGALALVGVAIAISVWQRVDLEAEVGVAAVRAFVQLTAVGYVIKLIFDSGTVLFAFLLIAVMVTVGALTARHRAQKVPRAFWPLLFALAIAAAATLGIVIGLGVFPAEARYLVPVGGMVIGNAMTASAVALNRLGDDIGRSTREVEAALALGATGRQALRPIVRRSLRSGLIPLIDQTKTTGLVSFPGIMVGSLLAGAAPVDAVRLQVVLLYVLLGATAISALTAMALASRNFLTADHQLREPPDASPPGG
jgi:putative ABC transport system permease protein